MRLVDADALKHVLCDECDYHETLCREKAECDTVSAIDAQPTVEAVPVKHGKWASSQGYAEVGECYCSVCKTVYYADDLFTVGETDEYGCGQALLPNYCPHCGAKMDEVTYDSD